MFAAVYFLDDKKIEIVNVKKIKKTDDPGRFNIKQDVFVPYKTMILDEAGREKHVDQDYKGTIAYLHKELTTASPSNSCPPVSQQSPLLHSAYSGMSTNYSPFGLHLPSTVSTSIIPTSSSSSSETYLSSLLSPPKSSSTKPQQQLAPFFMPSQEQFTSVSTVPQQISSPLSTPSRGISPTPQTSSFSSPSPSQQQQSPATPSRGIVSRLQTVEGYQTYFEPGENKVRLVEGHSLYIDATKMKGIKKTAKGQVSRLVRDLIAHFFSQEYLSHHSATGQKSTKPGLPHEIIDPIREFCAANHKMTAHSVNVIINRKCLDSKRTLKDNGHSF